MTKALTPVSSQEVLPREFTKQEADKVERKAVELFSRFNTSGVLFAAELRRLQDGGAHLIRGYPSFAAYAERTFEGLSQTNAQQISRQGNVMLILEKAGRIELKANDPNLPGATALRSLSRLLKDFGEDAMLAIYDKARDTGRKITAETVTAAARELVEPIKPAELGEGSIEPPEDQPGEDEAGYTEASSELLDRISDLHGDLTELHTKILEGSISTEDAVSTIDKLQRILDKEAESDE